MPRTHEELERIVLAGVNFMTSYLSLRQRIREEYLKLSNSPEWPNLPLPIRYAWLDLYALVDRAHDTMGEDIAELTEKRRWYQQNRRGNLRRRNNLRSKRLKASIAAQAVIDAEDNKAAIASINQAVEAGEIPPNTQYTLPSGDTYVPIPPSKSSPSTILPTTMSQDDLPELLKQIEAAKAKQAAFSEPSQNTVGGFDHQTSDKSLDETEH